MRRRLCLRGCRPARWAEVELWIWCHQSQWPDSLSRLCRLESWRWEHRSHIRWLVGSCGLGPRISRQLQGERHGDLLDEQDSIVRYASRWCFRIRISWWWNRLPSEWSDIFERLVFFIFSRSTPHLRSKRELFATKKTVPRFAWMVELTDSRIRTAIFFLCLF